MDWDILDSEAARSAFDSGEKQDDCAFRKRARPGRL